MRLAAEVDKTVDDALGALSNRRVGVEVEDEAALQLFQVLEQEGGL